MSKILSLVYANHGLIKIYQPTNSGKILFPVLRRCYSDDKSDDGNDPKDKAKAKLNSLLQDLKVSGALNIESNVDGKLAKPKFSKPVKRDKAGKLVSPLPSARDLDNDIVTATKDVAKLSSNKVKVESDLLRRLNRVAKDTKNAKNENEVSGESLESVMADIKIERPVGGSKKKQAAVLEKAAERQQLTMEQMAFLQKRAKLRRADAAQKQSSAPVDLRSGIPVGIFSGPMSQSADSDMISTWRACNKRELEVLSTPPPRNALEEMILQTKQGKLWQFPIDNEQGKILPSLFSHAMSTLVLNTKY